MNSTESAERSASPQCHGCGRDIDPGFRVFVTETPDGARVRLCSRSGCGPRALNDEIFARQCAAAAAAGTSRRHVEALFRRAGFTLPTGPRDVERITGLPATTFAEVAARAVR